MADQIKELKTMVLAEKSALYKKFKKNFNPAYCLAPESHQLNCSKKIVKAHTVSKAKGLKLIAQDGHVCSLQLTPENFEKHGYFLPPKLIGINKASTFTGFCSIHDDAVFSPLEKKNFSTIDKEHLFLLMYRAFSRGFYTKQAQLLSHLELLDYPFPDLEEYYGYLSNIVAGYEDNLAYRIIFDKMLVNSDFEKMRGVVFILNERPPVMCSGSFYPDQDFNGNNLQDIVDLTIIPSLISVTSFYESSMGGLIVFTWLDQDDKV